MSMIINTNLASENAIRLLQKNTTSQSTSMERLTSGMAINHAKDNAAGLAIVTKMDSQVRGTDQSIRNANDGMAMIQTMDGASAEIVDMLQRQRELAVQSLNGTYTKENRAQMDTEFQQLTKEIDRVATTTKFNGVNAMANLSTNGSVLMTKQSATNLQIGWEVAGKTGSRNKLAASRFNFNTTASGAANSLGTAGNIFGVYTFRGAAGSVVRTSGKFNGQTISTQATASIAVMKIDSALSNIGTVRAKWGAFQNRLEYTVSNLNSLNQNIKSARSQIQDTDYARESANLARTQVLQQAGMSMLSQSNQSSQNVLSLLR